jgi:hypothetical protein
MPANNYPITVYRLLWDALEAHAPVTERFKPGNRIRFDNGKRDPLKDQLGPGDLPQCLIRLVGVGDSLYTATPRYGYNASFDASAGQFKSQIDLTYDIELTTRGMDATQAHSDLMEVLTAIRLAGPTLGQTYIQTVGPAAATSQETVTETGELDTVIRIRLPVRLQVEGTQLVT